MFWILDKSLYSERAFESLLTVLERSETPHQVVSVVPFVGAITPNIEPEGPVFVMGKASMKHLAKERNYSPGYLEDNLDYRLYIQHYGEHMLNCDSVIKPIKDIEKIWDKFFMRPTLDSKTFNGQVITWDDFVIWRESVEKISDSESQSTLTVDDVMVMSPLQNDIYAEYRFFVVDGKVITGSMYKLGDTVMYEEVRNKNRYVWKFAQQMVDLWQPNRAFCLDICTIDAPGDFECSIEKVMEINSINSAGFYAMDMQKIVEAINDMGMYETT